VEKQWYIGTSGYHNYTWKNTFFPPGLATRKWFDFYTRHFNTLELNSTFYRFPRLATLHNWWNIAPDDFMFSAKVPKFVTHYHKFKDTLRQMTDFYGLLNDGLREKLGCVLFQLPPSLHYTDEILDKIIENTQPTFTNVIEFRHKSWWTKDVYDKLAEHNLIFCGHSYPKLPDKVVINSPVNYYRFHGVPRMYYSQYPNEFIDKIGNALVKNKKVKTAYIYFNNTVTVAAINNAMRLKNLVER
jgi:uncharacterized protein YecE (DUF72 family)